MPSGRFSRAGRIFAATVFLAVLPLSGCVTTAVDMVAEKPRIEVTDVTRVKSVMLSKVKLLMKRGQRIGQSASGAFCTVDANIVYSGTSYYITAKGLTGFFHKELKTAKYKVVGDTGDLFQDSGGANADFMIGAAVQKLRANFCYPGKRGSSALGSASMEVNWQIYDPLRRKIVYRVKTSGAAKTTEASSTGLTDIYGGAFAQATRNLLADKGFHDLVAGGAQPVVQKPIGKREIRTVALFSRPLAERINDIRLGVVTVLVADGHGSGFFIDARGLVLTNQHVVGGAKFVKLKLATGREVLGEVLATDAARDIALIQTEQIGVPPLPLRFDQPGVGSSVYAVGSPLDKSLGATVTRGIISAHRFKSKGYPLIQSDVDIQGGNSGGPLLDEFGNVVGVSVSGAGPGIYSVGINFFIPIGDALAKLNLSLDRPVMARAPARKVRPAPAASPPPATRPARSASPPARTGGGNAATNPFK